MKGPILLLTAVCSSLLLVACDTNPRPDAGPLPPPSSETDINGISIEAELNSDTGEVLLPLDRFTVDPVEEEVLTMAGTAAVAQCALESGTEIRFPPSYPEDLTAVYFSEHYFGPWTKGQAERWGFVRPSTPGDLVANGIGSGDSLVPYYLAPTETPTDEAWLAVDQCQGTETGAAFRSARQQDGGWFQEYVDLELEWKRSEPAIALLNELSLCYESNGMTPENREDQPWNPVGSLSDRINEEQIQLALSVVDCKDSIDFTERMAAIESAEQAPLVSKYSAEMIAKRQEIDKATVDARKFIAENQDRFYPQNPDYIPYAH